MNWSRVLLRMKRLAQNPPSRSRFYLFLGVLAASLILVGVERFVGWPEWATIERTWGVRPR